MDVSTLSFTAFAKFNDRDDLHKHIYLTNLRSNALAIQVDTETASYRKLGSYSLNHDNVVIAWDDDSENPVTYPLPSFTMSL